jgi:methyltransferase (TIGR00027 family)
MDNEEMSSSEVRVEHVSDTALMVAAARAVETARPDGVVRDPFAARLAGERGEALAQKLLSSDWLGIGVGLRCRTMDEMLLEAIAAHGIRTVVLLGAGLDTRPWRLDLPPDLHWIEVDFAPILEYKAGLMASETPRCRFRQIAANLKDAADREAVYAAAGSAPGLMVAEGLLLYLPAQTTEALATEPPRRSGIRHWLLDIAAHTLMQNAHPGTMDEIEKVRAHDRAEGQQILDLVTRNVWHLLQRRAYARHGFEVAAARGLQFTQPSAAEDPSGIYLFHRQ